MDEKEIEEVSSVKIVSYDDADTDPKLELPKNYLSPSAIDMYLKCPKKYEYHYVLGLSTPKTYSLVKGSAVHKGIETYYTLRLENHENIKSEEIAGFAVDKMDEIAKEGEFKLEGEDKNRAAKEVYTATNNYIHNVGESTKPVTVEAELRCIIKGVPVLGYTDLIREMVDEEIALQKRLVEDGVISEENAEVKTVVCDNKTSAKKWMQSNLDNSLQLNLYSLGTGINQQEIHNIVLNSTNCPTYKLNAVCSKSKGEHVANIVRDVAESITKGSFPRCGLGNWWCNDRFCDFYDVCRGGKV